MMSSSPTFFIVKTMNNRFFVGLDTVRFNHLHTTESGWLHIDGKIYIPPNNIDIIFRRLELPKFESLCEEFDIQGQDDYKETIMNYYKSRGLDLELIRLIAYFNDSY